MRGTIGANEREQPGNHVPPPRSENTLHHDRSGQPLDTAAHPARPHHTCSKNKRNLIYLIYTLTRTNESAHVPTRGNHLGGIQVRPTRASEEKARSGSPLLTRALIDKRKGFLASMKGNQPENALTNTTTKNPHTRSKIIPL